MTENNEYFLTTKGMTIVFPITRQGLSRWVDRGMPKKARNQYPLKECLDWIKTNVWGVGIGKEDFAQEKLKYQKARTRREELRVQQEEKSVIPRDQAIKWVSLLVAEAKAAFMNFPRRMGASLALISDEKEIEGTLRKEIYSILTELAKPLKDQKRKKK
jgi:hypothetical protein